MRGVCPAWRQLRQARSSCAQSRRAAAARCAAVTVVVLLLTAAAASCRGTRRRAGRRPSTGPASGLGGPAPSTSPPPAADRARCCCRSGRRPLRCRPAAGADAAALATLLKATGARQARRRSRSSTSPTGPARCTARRPGPVRPGLDHQAAHRGGRAEHARAPTPASRPRSWPARAPGRSCWSAAATRPLVDRTRRRLASCPRAASLRRSPVDGGALKAAGSDDGAPRLRHHPVHRAADRGPAGRRRTSPHRRRRPDHRAERRRGPGRTIVEGTAPRVPDPPLAAAKAFARPRWHQARAIRGHRRAPSHGRRRRRGAAELAAAARPALRALLADGSPGL